MAVDGCVPLTMTAYGCARTWDPAFSNNPASSYSPMAAGAHTRQIPQTADSGSLQHRPQHKPSEPLIFAPMAVYGRAH
eukprot:5116507-Pyramimonas_sp.AAC.1